jgi:hypothetical protein
MLLTASNRAYTTREVANLATGNSDVKRLMVIVSQFENCLVEVACICNVLMSATVL